MDSGDGGNTIPIVISMANNRTMIVPTTNNVRITNLRILETTCIVVVAVVLIIFAFRAAIESLIVFSSFILLFLFSRLLVLNASPLFPAVL